MRRAWLGAVVGWIAVCGLAAPAAAHRLAPSLLELRETGDGGVEVLFKLSVFKPGGVEVRPILPDHCKPVSEPTRERGETSLTLRWSARCEGGGLVGETLRVEGLLETNTDALVRVELADGRSARAVLSGTSAEFVVPARERPLDVFADYLALGFGHILSGFDHLLFVLGLVVLVRAGRALLATVTAFTVGHSVTLSLAVLGVIHFPSALAELGIAASIFVLALELVPLEGRRPSWLRRYPWAMACGFGLLHGLGFAGALAEVGLPAEEIPLALFSFNVGIEIGQLAFVACVLLVLAAGARLVGSGAALPLWLARAPAYAIGSLAAYWCFDRAVGLL